MNNIEIYVNKVYSSQYFSADTKEQWYSTIELAQPDALIMVQVLEIGKQNYLPKVLYESSVMRDCVKWPVQPRLTWACKFQYFVTNWQSYRCPCVVL